MYSNRRNFRVFVEVWVEELDGDDQKYKYGVFRMLNKKYAI